MTIEVKKKSQPLEVRFLRYDANLVGKVGQDEDITRTVLAACNEKGEVTYKGIAGKVRSIKYTRGTLDSDPVEFVLKWDQYIKLGRPDKIIVEESIKITPFK